MKRVLSLVLALVLVLGSMPLAFADNHMTAGDQLYEWNLIAGRSATEKDLDEEGTLTRAELMVLFAQLNGVAEEAESFELPSGFSDVAEGDWWAPWIAYGKMAGWTAGYPDGTFKPANSVSAQEMASFALNVLGYEVNWATAMEDAAALGIDVEAMNTAMLTRGEGFKVMLAVVNTVPNGETEKLGVKLGVLEPEAPVVVVPEELEVVSVEALNLVQIEVVFNQEVDKESAEKTDNYDVEDDDYDLQDATLLEDGMTVVLTLDLTDDIPGQEDVSEVTIKDVETADGEKVVKETFEIEYLDKTFPEALKAEVVGNDTIKVFFSEPIKTFAKKDFDVDGYYVKSVKSANNATEINVELYGTLEEGMLDIEVDNDVEDYAGYSILSQKFTIEVIEDDEAPFVVGYKNASTTEVTLIFNEDIEFANWSPNSDGVVTNSSTSDYEDDFYHTNTKNVFETAEIDGAELTLTFDDDTEMPEGTVYVYINGNAVNDLWDNENASTLRVAVEIEIDNEKPVVSDVYTSDDGEEYLVIEFSEDVEFDEDEVEDYFTLLDDNGDDADLDFDFVTGTKSPDDEITLEFEDELEGDYTLVVEGFVDRSGNKMDKVSIDFTAEDVSEPGGFTAKMYNQASEDQMIKVSFGEKMATDGKYSVDDVEKYILLDASDKVVKRLSDLDADAVISVVDNGKAVEIEIPSKVDDDEDGYNIPTTVKQIRVARVADAAGNFMDELYEDVTINPSATVDIDEVEAVDVDKVEITLADRLDDLDADDFKAYILTTTYTAIEIGVDLDEDSDGNSIVIINLLDKDMKYDASDLKIEIKDASSENVYGEKLQDAVITKTAGGNLELLDKIKPEVLEVDDKLAIDVTTSGSVATITVTFTEDLEADFITRTSVLEVAGFEGSEIKSVALQGSGDGNVMVITVQDTAALKVDDFEREDIVFSSAVRDVAGNKLADTKVSIPNQD